MRDLINEGKVIYTNFRRKLQEFENSEESALYNRLYKIRDEMGKIDGVVNSGSSDIDSGNYAKISLSLKVRYKSVDNNGRTYFGAFDVDLRKMKSKINAILKNNNASLSQFYVPKKKYWKDPWGNRDGGYENDRIDIEIQLHFK